MEVYALNINNIDRWCRIDDLLRLRKKYRNIIFIILKNYRKYRILLYTKIFGIGICTNFKKNWYFVIYRNTEKHNYMYIISVYQKFNMVFAGISMNFFIPIFLVRYTIPPHPRWSLTHSFIIIFFQNNTLIVMLWLSSTLSLGKM